MSDNPTIFHNNPVCSSVREYLTRNILLKNDDGSYDTNKYGQFWQLVWEVIVTQGHEPIGWFTVEGPIWLLSKYAEPEDIARVQGIMGERVKRVVDAKGYTSITQRPAKFDYD